MKIAGLSGSGLAELYKQQANTNYMNNRAKINSNYSAQQQNLYNQYFSAKKEEEAKDQAKLEQEQKNMFDMYVNKVDNSLNEYGFLDDDVREQLSKYFNKDSIGDHNYALLDEYMNSYTANDEQKAYIQEQEIIKENSPYYDHYRTEFLNEVTDNLLDNGKLTSDQVNEYLNKLDSIKDKIGSAYYDELKLALFESLETEEEKRIREEQGRANYAKLEDEIHNELYGYSKDDVFLEKVGKTIKRGFENTVEDIKNWWNKYISN